MDPVTAIGAVASIITLAQVALALSQSLVDLGNAISSAKEDLHSLADDLSLFSSSLESLSRLLNENKGCYSDEIYVQTARVMIQCAKLYEKIKAIMNKLNKEGLRAKLSWVLREKTIRKMIDRLRDLKGTLTLMIMMLQTDLQLKHLHISSSNLIERHNNRPLQPHTIESLEEAHRMANFHATNALKMIPVSSSAIGSFSTYAIEQTSVSDIASSAAGNIETRSIATKSSIQSFRTARSFQSEVDPAETTAIQLRWNTIDAPQLCATVPNIQRGSSDVSEISDNDVTSQHQLQGSPLEQQPEEKMLKFEDALGRMISFPFDLCATWDGTHSLISETFKYVDVLGPLVADSQYHLRGPNGETILPKSWETAIKPGLRITMHMGLFTESSESSTSNAALFPKEIETNKVVKPTPVIKGVSRPQKGVRVHNCNTCQKTFTRAEHLRRHQQSHEKAAFPCTFEDCDRSFHRQDLLDRHINRHETQGEKAYKSPNQRSRSLPSSPEPGHIASLNKNISSSHQTIRGTESNLTDIAPPPAGVGELQPGAAPYSNIQYATDINRMYSDHDISHELSIPTVTNEPRTPALTTMNPHFPYGNISPRQPSVYSGSAYTTIAPGATTYQLDIQIPEQYPNNLLGYGGSPWYASDSTSAPPDASRPRGGDFSYRRRSATIGSVSDWGGNGIPCSPLLAAPDKETDREWFSSTDIYSGNNDCIPVDGQDPIRPQGSPDSTIRLINLKTSPSPPLNVPSAINNPESVDQRDVVNPNPFINESHDYNEAPFNRHHEKNLFYGFDWETRSDMPLLRYVTAGESFWTRAFLLFMSDSRSSEAHTILKGCNDCFKTLLPYASASSDLTLAENLQAVHVAIAWPLHGLKQLEKILSAIQSNVTVQGADLPWKCIYAIVHFSQKYSDDKGKLDKLFAHLTSLASLVARYTIMENVHRHYGGLALHATYQDALLEFCIACLRYLGQTIRLFISDENLTSAFGPVSWNESFSRTMTLEEQIASLQSHLEMVEKADEKCRNFVIIFSETLDDYDNFDDIDELICSEEVNETELSSLENVIRSRKRGPSRLPEAIAEKKRAFEKV